jgi:hypothetical protein
MLERLIEAASRQADADCGRIFYLQTATLRRHYPDITGTVHLVDLVTATTIAIDTTGDETTDTTLATTDYVLLPKVDQGLAATRYQTLKASRLGGYRLSCGYAVDVTGSWGWVGSDGRAPAGIQTAVCIMASRLYMRRRAKLGRAVVLEAGLSEGLSKTDPDYLAEIEPFVHDSKRFEMA